LVMDNASYQRCYFVRDLATALGIEIIFLPPYSPNLNLILSRDTYPAACGVILV